MNIEIKINPHERGDYFKFLDCKKLARYEVKGNSFFTDKESYNALFQIKPKKSLEVTESFLFDYQRFVANLALRKKRFAAFLDCGQGKTLTSLVIANQIVKNVGKVLLLCPLQVMPEFFNDRGKFSVDIEFTNLRKQSDWDSGIGILNWESLERLQGLDLSGVAGIILDESSILKNGDGKTKRVLCDVAKGIEYRFCFSATPSPNEQSEYASHSTFLGITNNDLEFWAKFFRKDGNGWILKPHAVNHFYKHLSEWACYIHNPESLGFEKGGYMKEPPIYNRIKCEDFDLQFGKNSNSLFNVGNPGTKDFQKIYRERANQTTDRFSKVVESCIGHHGILWCMRNQEEKNFLKAIPNSQLLTGLTPIEQRVEIIQAWKARQFDTLITKGQMSGFGLNLQEAEKHIDSGYNFSFEQQYQKYRRSHRYGRKGRLQIDIPVTPSEQFIWDKLNQKRETFDSDVQELQKRMFEHIKI